jgi:hypothetical protein
MHEESADPTVRIKGRPIPAGYGGGAEDLRLVRSHVFRRAAQSRNAGEMAALGNGLGEAQNDLYECYSGIDIVLPQSCDIVNLSLNIYVSKLLTIMLFLFAVSRCFALLSPLFLAVIVPGRSRETRGFPQPRPILPTVFSWNNSDNSGPWRASPDRAERARQPQYPRRQRKKRTERQG